MRMIPYGSKLSLESTTFKRGCSKGVRDRYGVGVRKVIKNGWENIRTHFHFIVGDGTRVKFWKDLWYEKPFLEDAVPNLFNLAINKEGWVAEAWEEDGVGGSWGLHFNRHLNDWEVGQVESLLSKLHPLTIRRGVNDLLWWRENKNGTFSVKFFMARSQRALDLLSQLELSGRPGFQLGLASLVGRLLGAGYSPLIA